MGKKVKTAVVGLGRLGQYHAKNVKNHIEDAELVYVVDAFEEQAKQTAKELEAARWTTDPDIVLNDPEVEAVVIVTPTHTHGDLIVQAAKAGKHIFVEKPLTSTLEEADEVIRVIEEMGVICQVGFMRRFDPAYYAAKQRIEAGEIGKPIYFKAITRDFGCPPEAFIQHSGGIFLDCSIHDYDIARYLMGSEIVEVSGHGHVVLNDFMNEFNDVDQALTFVKFASGAAGDIEASRTSAHGYDIRAEIIGTEGTIFIGTVQNGSMTVLNKQGSRYAVVPDFQTRFHDAYISELNEFIACIQNRTEPRINALDSKINMEIALAATQSFLNNGEKIEIKSTKQLNHHHF